MTDIDCLVDKILAKNAAKCPELVVSILKSYGLDAVRVSDRTYKITHHHEWQYQAQYSAIKTKELLLCKCPELHIKSVQAYVERYKSIVKFEVG